MLSTRGTYWFYSTFFTCSRPSYPWEFILQSRSVFTKIAIPSTAAYYDTTLLKFELELYFFVFLNKTLWSRLSLPICCCLYFFFLHKTLLTLYTRACNQITAGWQDHITPDIGRLSFLRLLRQICCTSAPCICHCPQNFIIVTISVIPLWFLKHFWSSELVPRFLCLMTRSQQSQVLSDDADFCFDSTVAFEKMNRDPTHILFNQFTTTIRDRTVQTILHINSFALVLVVFSIYNQCLFSCGSFEYTVDIDSFWHHSFSSPEINKFPNLGLRVTNPCQRKTAWLCRCSGSKQANFLSCGIDNKHVLAHCPDLPIAAL